MEISTDERFRFCLEHLAKKFHCEVQHNGQRYFLHLTRINRYQLFDSIVNQIVTTMKTIYLQERIKIKNKTLVKVLINYDKKSDTVIAGSLFKMTPKILLDSIYDFSLTRLKYRWDEVVQLVNENYSQLTQKVLFNELLRFLILNMDHRIPEAHVLVVNHETMICDQKLQPLPQTDDDIINTLIEFAPRQIFIHNKQDLARDVIERIETLFANCVCIEYNAVL